MTKPASSKARSPHPRAARAEPLLRHGQVGQLRVRAGITMSGEKLNGSVIKVSPSKTPIVPINRDFMPRDEKELERCERTVYVNQIDRAVPGSAVEAMFESFCGAPPRCF